MKKSIINKEGEINLSPMINVLNSKKGEYEDTVDIVSLIEFIRKSVPVFGNKKLKFTRNRVWNLLENPHKAIRWLVVVYVNKEFMPIIEYHYYGEENEIVREAIVRRSKNIELLGNASLNDKREYIRKMALNKYNHLLNKQQMEEKNEESNIVSGTN